MKTNIEKFNALPQRQKKYARTKIVLLNALLDELETKPLSQIKIKNLSFKAEVSEPTFFNYFETKEQMLVYFVQMWSIEMNILAKKSKESSSSNIQTIKTIFIATANSLVLNPQIMLEIISYQTMFQEFKHHDISDGEKWLYFQDIDGVEELEALGLEGILPPLIEKAIKEGEIVADKEILFITLSSIFFGTSLLILKKDPKKLPYFFELELDFIFRRTI